MRLLWGCAGLEKVYRSLKVYTATLAATPTVNHNSIYFSKDVALYLKQPFPRGNSAHYESKTNIII
jgi:hypothetical protein